MSAEPRQITNTEVWTQWAGQIVNGVFPLRRFLGGSEHSAVFLTEHKAKNLPNAAIKIVPADPVRAEAQLAQWRTAAALSHPHLIRLFDVGRHQSGGHEFVFVVMEYAEQTLAQILPRRALTSDEAREMLLPTLDALAFLHRNQLAHGRLKPSNLLAVNDQLKLASDTLRPTSQSASGLVRTSAYDPPELKDRGTTTAGDIWSLGMTLAEALTQRTTAWPDETVSLPAGFPAPFANTVRRCLSLAPAVRPTVVDLETQYKQAAPTRPTSDPQPVAHQAARAAPSPEKRNLLFPALAIALPISLALWGGSQFWGTSSAPSQPPAVPTRPPAAPSVVAAEPSPGLASPVSSPATPPSAPSAASSSSVLDDVKPHVPTAILEKIQGRLYVTVRVLVDPAGDVVGTLMENPGPSKYFARLAEQAAGEWKFVPASGEDARVWLLRFEFTRNGVATRATAQ